MISNNDRSSAIKVDLDLVKKAFRVCNKNGESAININLLSKLIIFVGDSQIKDVEAIKTFKIYKVSDMNDPYYRLQLNDRSDSLRHQLSSLLNKPEAYSLKEIQKLKEWCFLLKIYITIDKLLDQASSIIGKNIVVKNKEELENEIDSLEKKLKNYNERLEIDMHEINLKEESVLVIPNEYILEKILEEAKEKEIEEDLVDVQAIYDKFPELSIVKGKPVVISFEYDNNDYVIGLLLVVVKKPTNNGFDTCTVGLIDWDNNAEEYVTTFEEIPEVALAKYIQDLLSSKNITYIEPKSTEKLLNVLI